MANVAMPRKTSKSTLAIYGLIAVAILVLFMLLGAAMDFSVKADGKVDISRVSGGFDKVVANPSILMYLLKTKGSYAQKMTFFGAMVIGIFVLYKYSEEKKRLHRKGVEHGSAKWGDKKEMQSLADKEKNPTLLPKKNADGSHEFDKNGNFVGFKIDNNIVLSNEVRLSLNSRQHLLNLNVLIIGGSGSGKTRFYAKPNIMQLNTSYVVTDPKGEILQSTGKMLKEAGYEVRVFNLIEMQHSNNYNPFHYVFDYKGDLSQDNIKKMVNVLFKSTKGEGEKEDFWSQKGQSLLEAIVFLLFEESEYNAQFDENGKIIPETRDFSHLNFFSVTEKMRKLRYPPSGGKQPDGYFLTKNEGESDEEFETRRAEAFLSPLDKDFIELEKRKPDSLAIRLYKEIRNAPEETGQSFLSSANVKTFMFNMENLRNLTCCDNIELEKLGDRKTALFIIISATDSTYNFLAAMMYTQLFDTLANRANFKYGGVLKVHVRCIMDEFANIGQIPDFDKVIAFVRSMGMSLNVIVQNLAQLKAKYEKTWEVITGNCDTHVFLGGSEESTLKYVSESLGKETIDITGRNRTLGRQKSTSENNSIIGRELMQPTEIKTMPISDCIVMIRSHNPFYCQKFPIEKHVNYEFLDDYDKSNKFDVATIHSVTVAEYQKKVNLPEKKCDTSSTFSESDEQAEKINNVFKREEVDYEVTFESLEYTTYTEAEMFAEITSDNSLSEEFIEDSSMYGVPSELEMLDLGEPIKEEVIFHDNEDEENEFVVTSMSEEESYSNEVNEGMEIFDDVAEEFAEFDNTMSIHSAIPDDSDFALDFDLM